MQKLYIKFEEGNQQSLDRACKEAERLGYRKGVWLLKVNGNNILILNSLGHYYTSLYNTIGIIKYKEHKIEDTSKFRNPENTIEYTITYKGISFHGNSIEDIKEQIEKKLSDNKSERRLLKEFREAI